jgi:hypothetical protein
MDSTLPESLGALRENVLNVINECQAPRTLVQVPTGGVEVQIVEFIRLRTDRGTQRSLDGICRKTYVYN